MGRKVHPLGFRLKVNRDWESRWYAEGRDYVELLKEDRTIRAFIKKEAEKAGVSRTEIERFPNQVVVTIHTMRPGIIIGREGKAVKKLKNDLETLTGKKVKVEVNEIDKPDMDAQLVAENIAGQLIRRIGHPHRSVRALGGWRYEPSRDGERGARPAQHLARQHRVRQGRGSDDLWSAGHQGLDL
jgi:small subunit ribosomal protein S3